MDTPQGFVAVSPKVPMNRGARVAISPEIKRMAQETASGAAANGGRAATRNGVAAGVGTAGHIAAKKPKQSGETLEKISRKAYAVWTFELATMLAARPLIWFLKKVAGEKGALAGYALFPGLLKTIHETEVQSIGKFPKFFLQNVKEHADILGGNATGVATTIGDRLTKIETAEAAKAAKKAAALSGQNIGAVAGAIATIKGKVKSLVGAFEKTAAGGAVEKGAQKIAGKSGSYLNKRYVASLEKSHAALTAPSVGFFKRIGNFFTRAKPELLAPHPELAGVAEHLTNARNAAGHAEAVTHLKSAKNALETLATKVEIGQAGKEVKSRIGNVMKSVEHTLSSAEIVHGAANIEKQNLTTMLKSAAERFGRVKAMNAVITVGVLSAVGAIALRSGQESREAKTAYKEMVADVGNANAPLLENIKKAYHQQGKARAVGSALRYTGELSNLAMMGLPGAGGKAVFGAQLAPMAAPLLVRDNQLINAYSVLKQAEKGAIQLPLEAKVEATKQLVAAVPAVAAHGGVLNHLATPLTEAIVQHNLSTRQLMQLLANDTKFTLLAKQVSDEQKAAQQAVADAAPEAVHATPEKPAPQVDGVKTVSPQEMVYHGRVTTAGKAMHA